MVLHLILRLLGGGGEMPIFRAKTGIRLDIDVNWDDTIESLKYKIKSKEGTTTSQLRLFYAGKELNDGNRWTDYNLVNCTILFVYHSELHLFYDLLTLKETKV